MRLTLKRHVQHCEAGSTLPIFALSLTAIVALVAATLALGMDSRAAGNLQATADSAALAGATVFVSAASPRAEDRKNQAEIQARASAEANSEYTLVDLGIDAVVEDPYGQHTRVEVALEFEPVNTMAKVAGRSSNVAIKRRAVAEATWGFPLCMLSLNKTGAAVDMSGRAELSAENCIVWSNSSSPDSLNFDGGRARAKGFCTVGGAKNGNRATPSPTTHCDAIPNPLKDWRPPAPGACLASGIDDKLNIKAIQTWFEEHGDHLGVKLKTNNGNGNGNGNGQGRGLLQNQVEDTIGGLTYPIGEDVRHLTIDGVLDSGPAKGLTLPELHQILRIIDNVDPSLYEADKYFDTPTLTLTPGTYCGLDIFEGHVHMEPGIYHIKDAPLTVRRKATLSGEDVTIVLTGEEATFSVLDHSRLDLAAAVDGRTAGFAIAQDVTRTPKISKDSEPITSRMAGHGRTSAIGTIYLPRQSLAISGKGAGEQASPLLQIVAHDISLADEGNMRIEFDTTKTDVPATIKPKRTARLVN